MRTMQPMRSAVLVLVLLAGCGGAVDAQPSCATRTGSYALTIADAGQCGAAPEQLTGMLLPDATGPGCTGQSVDQSPDGCTLTVVATCNGESIRVVSTETGGGELSGEMELTGPWCNGSLAFTAAKR